MFKKELPLLLVLLLFGWNACVGKQELKQRVSKGKKVKIKYVLKVQGKVVSKGEKSYVDGEGELLPALEKALAGKGLW